MTGVGRSLGRTEFVTLMALAAGLDAIALDAMLPALAQVANELGVADDNNRQFIVTSIFFGFALGLLFYGFLGDSFGRRKPILVGFVIFIAGTLVSMLAENLSTMLIGRVMQGLGAAGPYVLSVAIVRDLHHGRGMAEIMSLIMMVFILLPAVAPIIGQAILMVAHWRHIFLFLLVFAGLILLWFLIRQPETLPRQSRSPFSAAQMVNASTDVLGNSAVVAYTVALGLIFGAFIAFLSSAQQVFQEHYGLGKSFPLYLGSLAVSLGIAAYLNARLVARFGMFVMISRALGAVCITTWVFLVLDYKMETGLSLSAYMVYMAVVYFCMGVVFGNLMSLALEPMGHIAGAASAIVGFSEIMIATTLGGLIGSLYAGSVTPIVAGFAVASPLALLLVVAGHRRTVYPVESDPAGSVR